MMCRHIASWRAAIKTGDNYGNKCIGDGRNEGGEARDDHRASRDVSDQYDTGDDAFGHFPECFRNNTSKRTRSSYITAVC